MYRKCETCGRGYDDEVQNTICPHPPLGFGAASYCPKCDTLKEVHGACGHQSAAPTSADPVEIYAHFAAGVHPSGVIRFDQPNGGYVDVPIASIVGTFVDLPAPETNFADHFAGMESMGARAAMSPQGGAEAGQFASAPAAMMAHRATEAALGERLGGGRDASTFHRIVKGAMDSCNTAAPEPGPEIHSAMNFEAALSALINRHSMENESNTPDYLLAKFLRECLAIFGSCVHWRDKFYQFDPQAMTLRGVNIGGNGPARPTFQEPGSMEDPAVAKRNYERFFGPGSYEAMANPEATQSVEFDLLNEVLEFAGVSVSFHANAVTVIKVGGGVVASGNMINTDEILRNALKLLESGFSPAVPKGEPEPSGIIASFRPATSGAAKIVFERESADSIVVTVNQIREAFGPTALEQVHDVTKYVFPADVREDARLIFKRKGGLPSVVITVADVQAWHNHFSNGADGSSGSIPVAAANPNGLHQRYRVSRIEGPTDPRAVYFVLRLDRFGRDPVHVEACRAAARAYAQAVKGSALEQVGQDLRQLVLNLAFTPLEWSYLPMLTAWYARTGRGEACWMIRILGTGGLFYVAQIEFGQLKGDEASWAFQQDCPGFPTLEAAKGFAGRKELEALQAEANPPRGVIMQATEALEAGDMVSIDAMKRAKPILVSTKVATSAGEWTVYRRGQELMIVDAEGRNRHASRGHSLTGSYLAGMLADQPFRSTETLDQALKITAAEFIAGA